MKFLLRSKWVWKASSNKVWNSYSETNGFWKASSNKVWNSYSEANGFERLVATRYEILTQKQMGFERLVATRYAILTKCKCQHLPQNPWDWQERMLGRLFSVPWGLSREQRSQGWLLLTDRQYNWKNKKNSS